MCNPVAIPIAIAAAGAAMKGISSVMGGNAEQQVAEAQRKAALYQEQDSLERGADQAGQLRSRGTQVAGAQRAATAANGIASDSRTAQNLFATTATLNEQDVSTARYNGLLDAWGHAYEAEQATFAKKMARRKTVLGILAPGVELGANAYSAYQANKSTSAPTTSAFNYSNTNADYDSRSWG